MSVTTLGLDLPDCDNIRFASEPTLKHFDGELVGGQYIPPFQQLDDFFTNYERNRASQDVRDELQDVERRTNERLNESGDDTWYGLKSKMGRADFRFLYERNEFVYKEIYKETKEKIWERINQLLRSKSLANIVKKNFEWNDKELGVFSFDRASLSLSPKYAYYSFIHKKTYQEDFIRTEGAGDNTKYYLKSDNTEITLCYEINLYKTNEKGEDKIYVDAKKPINLDEINNIGFISVVSDIRNCFLYQVPKPKVANAVRIFIDFGCNRDKSWDEKIYTGLFGVVLSEFFEFMGYSTSIIPYIGFQRYSKNKRTTVYRLLSYQAKKFTETLETEKLLVSCSDIAFFRTRFFFYAHLLSDSYGDEVLDTIGINMDREQKQCSIIQAFKNKDKNLDCFYYNIAEIYSEDELLQNLTYLILNVDNENKKLNEVRNGVKDNTILTDAQLRAAARQLNSNPNP